MCNLREPRRAQGLSVADLNIDLTVNGLRLDDPWLTGTSAEIIDALCGEFWPIQTGDETETESVPSRVIVHPPVVQAMEQVLTTDPDGHPDKLECVRDLDIPSTVFIP